MKLPYGSAAKPEQIAYKLATYSLNRQDPRGCHKAILFQSKLGITIENKEVLITALLNEAIDGEATFKETTQYGSKYLLDFLLTTQTGTSVIRSAWIIRNGETYPRLTTVYPMKSKEPS